MRLQLSHVSSIAAVAFALAAVPTPALAAADAFMKIEGIAGESKDAGHPGWIEIRSFSFGTTNAASAGGSGRGPGRVSIVKEVDKASPLLKQKCATDQHLPEVTLAMRKAGGDPSASAYLTYVLHDAIVSSCSMSGGGERPQETLSINFTKIEQTSQGAPATFGQSPANSAPLNRPQTSAPPPTVKVPSAPVNPNAGGRAQ